MTIHFGPLATIRTAYGPAIGVLLVAAATITVAMLVSVVVLGPP